MFPVTPVMRHEVANRLSNSPAGRLDPAAPLLTLRGYCPLCGEAVAELRDALSVREFKISGLCQRCQDSTFGAEGDSMEVPTDPEQFNELEDVSFIELD